MRRQLVIPKKNPFLDAPKASHPYRFFLKLRAGDVVLVNDPPFQHPVQAVVTQTYINGGLAIQLEDKRTRFFSSREGFADILAGARLIDGNWSPI